MLVSNHVSFLDPVIIGGAADRELHFLGADSYFRIPCLGWLFTQLNGIPIKRATPGWQSLKEAISRLRIGKAVGIFPEGTRSADGTLGEVKKGIDQRQELYGQMGEQIRQTILNLGSDLCAVVFFYPTHVI